MEGVGHDGREETVKGAAVVGWSRGKAAAGWEWFFMEGQAKMGSFTMDHPLTS